MKSMEIIGDGTAEHFEDLVAVDQIAQQDPERREELRKWLKSGTVRIAIQDGSPVGYTVVEPSFFGNDFLVLIAVGDQHRKAGIGQLLMGDVESTERHTKLFTSTNLSNQVMQRLLARRGWVSSGMVFGLDEGDPELFYQFPQSFHLASERVDADGASL
ncbi:GNAT family N-acetyltransferase [Arthrobacter sp. ISL-95]|uniref:GNAT family N-acetyltransferase n=1 Tax=Arthrobacter sp. ISL-95 TaxID=2819116 RepID=UPI001BEBD74F|nr:GNAT family N-acetyltransferase [Arthrobacter sp. ISL-95]MBT2588548.1 GNAT family N-acetyltransferase [Arthrobacter sp. ISL-95]